MSWTSVNQGFTNNVNITDLIVVHDTLFASTVSRWIWARPLSELLPPSSVEDVTTGESATRLGLSIPNPAASEVVIPYMLGRSGHVTLTLYDALLREAASAVDEDQESGLHTARVDVTGLANGVYYYRIAANGKVLTRQMVVVR